MLLLNQLYQIHTRLVSPNSQQSSISPDEMKLVLSILSMSTEILSKSGQCTSQHPNFQSLLDMYNKEILVFFTVIFFSTQVIKDILILDGDYKFVLSSLSLLFNLSVLLSDLLSSRIDLCKDIFNLFYANKKVISKFLIDSMHNILYAFIFILDHSIENVTISIEDKKSIDDLSFQIYDYLANIDFVDLLGVNFSLIVRNRRKKRVGNISSFIKSDFKKRKVKNQYLNVFYSSEYGSKFVEVFLVHNNLFSEAVIDIIYDDSRCFLMDLIDKKENGLFDMNDIDNSIFEIKDYSRKYDNKFKDDFGNKFNDLGDSNMNNKCNDFGGTNMNNNKYEDNNGDNKYDNKYDYNNNNLKNLNGNKYDGNILNVDKDDDNILNGNKYDDFSSIKYSERDYCNGFKDNENIKSNYPIENSDTFIYKIKCIMVVISELNLMKPRKDLELLEIMPMSVSDAYISYLNSLCVDLESCESIWNILSDDGYLTDLIILTRNFHSKMNSLLVIDNIQNVYKKCMDTEDYYMILYFIRLLSRMISLNFTYANDFVIDNLDLFISILWIGVPIEITSELFLLIEKVLNDNEVYAKIIDFVREKNLLKKKNYSIIDKNQTNLCKNIENKTINGRINNTRFYDPNNIEYNCFKDNSLCKKIEANNSTDINRNTYLNNIIHSKDMGIGNVTNFNTNNNVLYGMNNNLGNNCKSFFDLKNGLNENNNSLNNYNIKNMEQGSFNNNSNNICNVDNYKENINQKTFNNNTINGCNLGNYIEHKAVNNNYNTGNYKEYMDQKTFSNNAINSCNIGNYKEQKSFNNNTINDCSIGNYREQKSLYGKRSFNDLNSKTSYNENDMVISSNYLSPQYTVYDILILDNFNLTDSLTKFLISLSMIIKQKENENNNLVYLIKEFLVEVLKKGNPDSIKIILGRRELKRKIEQDFDLEFLIEDGVLDSIFYAIRENEESKLSNENNDVLETFLEFYIQNRHKTKFTKSHKKLNADNLILGNEINIKNSNYYKQENYDCEIITKNFATKYNNDDDECNIDNNIKNSCDELNTIINLYLKIDDMITKNVRLMNIIMSTKSSMIFEFLSFFNINSVIVYFTNTEFIKRIEENPIKGLKYLSSKSKSKPVSEFIKRKRDFFNSLCENNNIGIDKNNISIGKNIDNKNYNNDITINNNIMGKNIINNISTGKGLDNNINTSTNNNINISNNMNNNYHNNNINYTGLGKNIINNNFINNNITNNINNFISKKNSDFNTVYNIDNVNVTNARSNLIGKYLLEIYDNFCDFYIENFNPQIQGEKQDLIQIKNNENNDKEKNTGVFLFNKDYFIIPNIKTSNFYNILTKVITYKKFVQNSDKSILKKYLFYCKEHEYKENIESYCKYMKILHISEFEIQEELEKIIEYEHESVFELISFVISTKKESIFKIKNNKIKEKGIEISKKFEKSIKNKIMVNIGNKNNSIFINEWKKANSIEKYLLFFTLDYEKLEKNNSICNFYNSYNIKDDDEIERSNYKIYEDNEKMYSYENFERSNFRTDENVTNYNKYDNLKDNKIKQSNYKTNENTIKYDNPENNECKQSNRKLYEDNEKIKMYDNIKNNKFEQSNYKMYEDNEKIYNYDNTKDNKFEQSNYKIDEVKEKINGVTDENIIFQLIEDEISNILSNKRENKIDILLLKRCLKTLLFAKEQTKMVDILIEKAEIILNIYSSCIDDFVRLCIEVISKEDHNIIKMKENKNNENKLIALIKKSNNELQKIGMFWIFHRNISDIKEWATETRKKGGDKIMEYIMKEIHGN